ncbi:DUF4492 domain-containing protein [Falsiporphyromonas endometrii]|uniref:DUF4492 domain-containing protein n=1 Tax=Falsiporphyromonas endometrii TaxID=1387297 RepID=A0ABV9K7K4_9PORP
MSKQNPFKRVFKFYVTGFKEMTLGKTLWLIILIKLFIIFVILRIFLFPRFLGDKGDDKNKADYVRNELIDRKAK